MPTGSTKPPIFADYPYDVYARDGGAFATALWNDVIDARRSGALARRSGAQGPEAGLPQSPEECCPEGRPTLRPRLTR